MTIRETGGKDSPLKGRIRFKVAYLCKFTGRACLTKLKCERRSLLADK